MASKSIQDLFQKTDLERADRLDRAQLGDLFDSRGSNFFRKGTAPLESKISENFIFLEEGDHKGMTVSKKQTIVIGKPGAMFTSPVIVENGGSVIFQNCYFEQTPNNTERLALIKEGGRAVFQNCIFKKFDSNNKEKVGTPTVTSSYISLETSIFNEDMATFTGCIFREDAVSNAVSVVTNIGTSTGKVYISYSINQTGIAFGAAVTSLGNLT